MNLLKRGIATLATASVALLALPATAAFALDGPVARADYFSQEHRGLGSYNLLTNDTWDADHTAELVSVTRTSGTATYSFTADGTLTVDFGAYTNIESPSSERVAAFSYVMRDSAGQQASGSARVFEYNPPTPIVANPDPVVGLGTEIFEGLGDADPVPFEGTVGLNVMRNDVYGLDDNGAFGYRLEIVSAPTTGQISVARNHSVSFTASYTPAELVESQMLSGDLHQYTAYRDDTFTYRLCLLNDPAECSNVTSAGIRYRFHKVTMALNATAGGAEYYRDAADQDFSTTVDPRADLLHYVGNTAGYESFTPAVVAALTPELQSTTVGLRNGGELTTAERNAITSGTWQTQQTFVNQGGGTWIHSLAPNTPAHAVTRYQFGFRDAGGVQVARLTWSVALSASTAAATPRNDEVWAAVGQEITIPVFLNDDLPQQPALSGSSGYRAELLADGALGQFGQWEDDQMSPARDVISISGAADVRTHYTAGIVPGDEVLDYRLCSPIPVSPYRVNCSTATLTIHVTPRVGATNDYRIARPGDTLTVPVLGNDIYTDTPSKTADVLVLTDVPAGVDARVLNDRAVEVKVPAGFEGDTLNFGYRLSDFTGTATARVVVNIERETPNTPPVVVEPPVLVEPPVVVDPPVVDPPVVDPPVVPPVVDPLVVDPPKARNDHSKAKVGGKVTVDAFGNDNYQGTGTLLGSGWTVVGDDQDGFVKHGKGYKVTATRGGKMTVEVSPAFKGDQIRFGYGLTDETGLSDKATVTVEVTRPVAVPPFVKAGGVFDLDGIQSGDTAEDAVVATVATAAVAPAAGGHGLAMLTGWALLTLAGAALYRRKMRRA